MVTSGVSVSPCSEELWQSYNNARSKEKTEMALSRFTAYIEKWAESGEKTVKRSPMISSSCDRYGHLKPCLA